MDKKDIIIKLNQLHNDLHDRLCYVSDALNVLKGIIYDAGLDCKFDLTQYLTSEELEEELKEEITNGGLERLYYFLNDIDLHNLEVVKLDNYGNCEYRVGYAGMIELINEISDTVEGMQDEDFN